MSFRNLSPQEMFIRLAEEHIPRYRFSGKNKNDFETWKNEALPLVKATVGAFPETVGLNPELQAEWQHDGLRKQRWIIDVSKHISAMLQVNFPAELPPGQKLPGILCWHGHAFGGKEPVMGNDSSADLKEVIRRHNYDYGHRMAKEGFVTFALDWFKAPSIWEHTRHWLALALGLVALSSLLGRLCCSLNGLGPFCFCCLFLALLGQYRLAVSHLGQPQN